MFFRSKCRALVEGTFRNCFQRFGEYDSFQRSAGSKRTATQCLQRSAKVDACKRSTSCKRTVTYCRYAVRKYDTFQCGNAAERIVADCLQFGVGALEVDFGDKLATVKCVVAYAFHIFGNVCHHQSALVKRRATDTLDCERHGHFVQRRALVKCVIGDFFQLAKQTDVDYLQGGALRKRRHTDVFDAFGDGNGCNEVLFVKGVVGYTDGAFLDVDGTLFVIVGGNLVPYKPLAYVDFGGSRLCPKAAVQKCVRTYALDGRRQGEIIVVEFRVSGVAEVGAIAECVVVDFFQLGA